MAEPLLIAKHDTTECHLLPGLANRHGLITGATGTGKTVTLQTLAENFSRIGVPVFMADVKGDLTGASQPGKIGDKLAGVLKERGLDLPTPLACPTTLWDVFGEQGHPVRATVSDMGPLLLGRMLNLNETQLGVLNLVFKIADDNGLLLLDLKDLRAMLQYVGDNAKEFTTEYGNVSAASVGAIQRGLLQIEQQGGDKFFGEPMLDIQDFMQTDTNGHGVVNILAADKLMNSPRLYATFLLWMLSELFETLPEIGDPEKPKLVFFFDEAHLLFHDASDAFVDQIAQTVRLIRSKGVGVVFVTQSPTDVPDEVLAQLGSRIQHQLRAHTPNDAKALKATVNTYPSSAYDDLGSVITSLGIGEAVVTVMNERGAPTPVAWTRLRAPESLMGPADPAAMEAVVQASPRFGKYAASVDRDSARERLAARLEEGAAKEAAEAETKARAKDAKAKPKPRSRASRTDGPAPQDEGIVHDVVTSPAFKDFMRTAAREIARGMFKTGRR